MMRRTLFGCLLTLSLALPARAQSLRPHDWPIHAALTSYMALQGADLSITMYDLGRYGGPNGQVKEANPIFAPLVERPALAGAIKIGLAASSSFALLKLHDTHPKVAFVAALAGNALYSWVVWHNTHLPIH
jgi:Domain of unknown function (DUF5658)